MEVISEEVYIPEDDADGNEECCFGNVPYIFIALLELRPPDVVIVVVELILKLELILLLTLPLPLRLLLLLLIPLIL